MLVRKRERKGGRKKGRSPPSLVLPFSVKNNYSISRAACTSQWPRPLPPSLPPSLHIPECSDFSFMDRTNVIFMNAKNRVRFSFSAMNSNLRPTISYTAFGKFQERIDTHMIRRGDISNSQGRFCLFRCSGLGFNGAQMTITRVNCRRFVSKFGQFLLVWICLKIKYCARLNPNPASLASESGVYQS